MKTHELIALVRADEAFKVLPNVTAERHGDYVAVLGQSARISQRLLGRRAILKRLEARQHVLEHLMTKGTVLPFLPGTHLPKTALATCIMANAPLLDRLTRECQDKAQYQISLSWDAAEARKHFGWHSPDDAKRGTDAFSSEVRTKLERASVAYQELPREGGMVQNAVVLTGIDDPTALDQALEEIDATWTEGLAIRQIGPSPPVSFCSLGLRQVTRQDTAAARKTLRLPSDFDVEALAFARRQALLTAPPDQREAITTAAEICSAARRAGHDHFAQLFKWSEGQAAQSGDIRKVA